jgi:tetratricopeptide (TPR) repeat protein
MLDSHPEVWGMGEDSIFNVNLPAFRDDVAVAIADKSTGGMKHLREVITKHGQFVQDKMIEKARNFTKSSSSPSKNILHVVDKMLFNFRNIGFIHLMYPNAVIIHTIRDPMDTIFSCWKHKFDDHGLSWSLSEEHLTLQFLIYLETIEHFRKVLPNRILEVRYEALIANPKKELSRVIDRIGIDWDDNMLYFFNSNRSVQTHSQSQVRHGLSTKSIGSWRKYSKHLHRIISLLKPKLVKLKRQQKLPFVNQMNWDLDPKFNYTIAIVQPKTDPKPSKALKKDKVKPQSKVDTVREARQSSKTKMVETAVVIGEHGHVVADRGDTIRLSGDGVVRRFSLVSTKSSSSEPSSLSPCLRAKLDYQPSIKALYHHEFMETSLGSDRENESQVNSYEEMIDSIVSHCYSYFDSPNSIRKDDLVGLASILPHLLDIVYAYAQDCNDTSASKTKKYIGYESKRLADRIMEHILLQSKAISEGYEEVSQAHNLWYMMAVVTARNNQADVAINYLSLLLGMNHDHLEGRQLRLSLAKDLNKQNLVIEDTSHLLDYYSSLGENLHSSAISEHLITRGSSYFQSRRFISAHADFVAALNISYSSAGFSFERVDDIRSSRALPCFPSSALLWNVIGKCEKEFGDWHLANRSQSQALRCKPDMKEAYHDKAVAVVEGSHWEEALDNLDRALILDPSFKNSYGYQALVFNGLGRTAEAVDVLGHVLELDRTELQGQYLRASYMQTLGRYNDSIAAFDELIDQLSVKMAYQGHNVDDDIRNRYINAWFKRELVAFHWIHLDDDLRSSYNIERSIHPRVKEGHSSQINDRTPMEVIQTELIGSSYHESLPSSLPEIARRLPHADMQDGSSLSKLDNMRMLLTATARIGGWIQLKTPGFLPNQRQHRMFGLAVLEIAQALEDMIISKGELLVDDKISSKLSDHPIADANGSHIFGWRDLFDIAVKWRRISEANDVVWWIDQIVSPQDQRRSLSESSSGDQRVGLNTYMLHGVGKVVRYYPYYNQSFQLMKEHIVAGIAYNAKESYLRVDEKAKHKVMKAKSVSQLYKAVYSQPLFVVPRIQSLLHPERYLNGTRITLMPSLVEGYDFSICSASTMDRFLQYEEEHHHVFSNYLNSLASLTAEDHDPAGISQLLDEALTLFYYWVNYAPITRGTSATGYAALYGCIVVAGYEIESNLPDAVQLDWEAILRSDPKAFIAHVKPWFRLIPRSQNLSKYFHLGHRKGSSDASAPGNIEDQNNEALLKVKDVFSTARSILQAVNGNLIPVQVAEDNENAY